MTQRTSGQADRHIMCECVVTQFHCDAAACVEFGRIAAWKGCCAQGGGVPWQINTEIAEAAAVSDLETQATCECPVWLAPMENAVRTGHARYYSLTQVVPPEADGI